jgi:hypothetical protein
MLQKIYGLKDMDVTHFNPLSCGKDLEVWKVWEQVGSLEPPFSNTQMNIRVLASCLNIPCAKNSFSSKIIERCINNLAVDIAGIRFIRRGHCYNVVMNVTNSL